MDKPSTAHNLSHEAPSERWLALRRETALNPDQRIIDAHHHLWDRQGHTYLLPQFQDDVGSGHNIVASVFVQCRAMYRTDGPAAMAPVGETEFINGIAAMGASGRYGPMRVAAGIVGFADLMLGADAKAVLEQHIAAGGGRFRGVRHIATWDADARVMNPTIATRAGMLDHAAFRAGFACLASLGLTFDAWVFHPQLQEVERLARAYSGTRIVVNHLGGPLNIHSYAGRRMEVLRAWESSIRSLAQCDNVYMKLGGFGMRISGFDYADRAEPPGSEQLASDWAPYVQACIDAFGPQRCMFESNFPVDKTSVGYTVLWNAYKRLAAEFSQRERDALFYGSATDFYALQLS
jgi:L-fuconolactonase